MASLNVTKKMVTLVLCILFISLLFSFRYLWSLAIIIIVAENGGKNRLPGYLMWSLAIIWWLIIIVTENRGKKTETETVKTDYQVTCGLSLQERTSGWKDPLSETGSLKSETNLWNLRQMWRTNLKPNLKMERPTVGRKS